MSVRKLLPIVLVLAAVVHPVLRVAGRAGRHGPGHPDHVDDDVDVDDYHVDDHNVIPALDRRGSRRVTRGQGLASATVFTFFLPPRRGRRSAVHLRVEFWRWRAGCWRRSHPRLSQYGHFTAAATAIDSRGMTAQASTTVAVRNVTGRWTATFPPARPGARADRSGAEPDGGDGNDQRARNLGWDRVRDRHGLQPACR